ncbi:MAG: gamma-glutamyl-gamma-aminobutyrate hydrolase family protein [Pseudanabaenaceae cyanobacterium SKYGB_i_bin29]|nr:gamma-glutamyl-gamma-aminobutyrate hydrolase family protein [Pseudanabaenaceae cyanobacterium SKYG29]MDW8420543.1 gamma-glutamyl-gamma-aminobutyrate hydrolase family protein [Pseudanabaenaceae cyanobacterium SKYGB_i_bin29]
MSYPVIGISIYGRNQEGDFYLPGAYVDVVRKAGGLPMLLPPGESQIDALLDQLDGLILAGGGDIDPQFLSSPTAWHPKIYGVDLERDIFELALVERVMQRQIPVLGVCRGLQVIGVAGGAELVVHIPDVYGETVLHRLEEPSRSTEHGVTIASDSRLARTLQTTSVQITSWHHQAIASAPPQWRVVATAEDGVIEAIEHTSHPWAVAVQWHPEMMNQMALFVEFVEASRQLGRGV